MSLVACKLLNNEKLYLSDEFVRHKTLNILGNSYIIDHALKNILVSETLYDTSSLKIVTFNDNVTYFIEYLSIKRIAFNEET